MTDAAIFMLSLSLLNGILFYYLVEKNLMLLGKLIIKLSNQSLSKYKLIKTEANILENNI